MKPTAINHPFRTISLSYNSNAPLSEFEQKAIEKYTGLHDETHAWKKLISDLLSYYKFGVVTQMQCMKALKNLQNEYTLLAPMIHYFEEGSYIKENEMEEVPEEERVCYNTQPLMVRLEIFKYSYNDYLEPLKQAEKDYEELVQLQEKVENIFDEFDEQYFSPIIHDWKNMEIDTASFDQDFDHYREALSKVYKLDDMLCDARNTFVQRHIPINDQVGALDKDLAALFAVLKKYEGPNQD